MAGDVTFEQALATLRRPETINGSTFGLLRTVSSLAAEPESASNSRELLIRLLERREELDDSYIPILDSLTVKLGLFPYLPDGEDLGVRDQIALEYHRPPELEDEGVVFHSMQKLVYDKIMSGENVVLSAPTSFGKSVIVDALVASRRWDNIVIVVPTLALIDETRRRLSRFSDLYKVLTYPGQEHAHRNLFIMTQERLLEVDELADVGLFVIDEFYKLDVSGETDRATLLNLAWDRLRRTGAQYYMTGPNVSGLDEALPSELRDSLIVTDFRTVAVDQESVGPGDARERLAEICQDITESTLIYCSSPKRVREVGAWLLEDGLGVEAAATEPAAAWVRQNYDADWILGRCLAKGIGLHHGRVPRALQHHMVRMFNEGMLRYLVCTSTLIEGVNTAARNVIIVDGKLARQRLDYFTFSNIRGRAGRMFRHFIGRVFVFSSPPEPEQTTIDIPISSQSDRAGVASLIQLPREELSGEAWARVSHLYEQDLLSIDVLRQNRGIDPDRQLELASEIASEPRRYSDLLSWSGIPKYNQMRFAAGLILSYLVEPGQRGRVTDNSVVARLNAARNNPGNVPNLVESQLRFSSDRDDAVEEVLFFIRNWMGHLLPRGLAALESVQREVLARLGQPYGNYRFYAQQIESQFLPAFFTTLEEYGLPVQVALKLRRYGLHGDDLDELLLRLKVVAANPYIANAVDPFEREMLDEVVAGLGPQSAPQL